MERISSLAVFWLIFTLSPFLGCDRSTKSPESQTISTSTSGQDSYRVDNGKEPADHETQAITIGAMHGFMDWVTVANPGNPSDDLVMTIYETSGYGSVPYVYDIGKYEVTNQQYVAFLNAVASKADIYELFHPDMTEYSNGGIVRAGKQGRYVYSVKLNMANKPAVWVTFYNAIRFANWMHNGGGNGNTEDGAYTLLGGQPEPTNGSNIVRNSNARVWLPNENEWYKAAYYDPNKNGVGGYWLYPTGTNERPCSSKPPGNNAPNPANTGNFYQKNIGEFPGYENGFAVTASLMIDETECYLSDVGAYTSAASPYGTFDQGGNACEWNESLIDEWIGEVRVCRGGAWDGREDGLRASYMGYLTPAGRFNGGGFRVARHPAID